MFMPVFIIPEYIAYFVLLTFPENHGTKLRQQKILVENEVKKSILNLS